MSEEEFQEKMLNTLGRKRSCANQIMPLETASIQSMLSRFNDSILNILACYYSLK